MNCDILSTLYVKSNGEILCNDDFGERISLGSCLSNNAAISISGWAASESKLSYISVSVGDNYLGDLSFVIRRPDVVADHAVFNEVLCGFDTLLPSDQIAIEPGQLLRFDFFHNKTKLASFRLAIPITMVPTKTPDRIFEDNSIACLIQIDRIVIHGDESTSIHDTLNNDRYKNIRAALQDGKTPWPNVCEHCSFFRPDEPYSNDLFKDRIIQKIQFESSLACALKCPQCSNLVQIKTRSGARHLGPGSMSDLLKTKKKNEYQIRSIEDCGQGEPLNNPRFPELLATARRIFPSTLQRVITNGNHDYSKTMGTEYVEEIVVAIDGAYQESYEKYRVKGDISKAFKFMSDAIEFQKPKGGLVVWKYVLFETNDSDEELLEAQRLGDQLGVSRLWFVHSHTSNRSKRYTYEDPHTIPIISSRVKIDSHPSYFRHAVTIAPAKAPDRIFGDSSIFCLMHIDMIVIHANGSISISGWAASESSLSHISLSVDDNYIGDLSFVIRRPDVVALHAAFNEVLCGFDSLVPFNQTVIESGKPLRFDLFDNKTKVASFGLAIEDNTF
jgi:MoaA/NifB/PqqE/SkfB family radical SAM enzyme